MTRYLHMFQPAPTAPQLPPDNHLFQVSQGSGGPWTQAVGAVKVPSPAINCSSGSLGAGDCYLITFNQGPTDTYLKATAQVTVTGVTYGADSLPVALPETNLGFTLGVGILLLVWFFTGNRRAS